MSDKKKKESIKERVISLYNQGYDSSEIAESLSIKKSYAQACIRTTRRYQDIRTRREVARDLLRGEEIALDGQTVRFGKHLKTMTEICNANDKMEFIDKEGFILNFELIKNPSPAGNISENNSTTQPNLMEVQ